MSIRYKLITLKDVPHGARFILRYSTNIFKREYKILYMRYGGKWIIRKEKYNKSEYRTVKEYNNFEELINQYPELMLI